MLMKFWLASFYYLRAKHSLTELAPRIGPWIFILLVIRLAVRLRYGADLSDEAYYIAFLDDWFKSSLADGKFHTIHQTAALLVYPIALLYRWVVRGTDGLVLFLRAIYLAQSAIAALFWTAFLKSCGYSWLAWIGGFIVVAFIPFGLPAPSYNTIGLDGLIIGFAAYGLAALGAPKPPVRLAFFAVAGIAFTVATIAYPPLIVLPFVFWCLAFLFLRQERRTTLQFGIWIVCLILIGWLIVFHFLPVSLFFDSLSFNTSVKDGSDFANKTVAMIHIIGANPVFTVLLASSVLVGVLRIWLPAWLGVLLVGLLISCLFLSAPVLYVRSHDIITIAALTGLSLATELRRGAGPAERVVGLIYLGSMLSGVINIIASSNPGFNFCLGALPAASLSILGPPGAMNDAWRRLPTGMIASVAILTVSLSFYYGELPGADKRGRVEFQGTMFDGVFVDSDDADLLKPIAHAVVPQLSEARTVAVFGRKLGLSLVTPWRLKALSPFPPFPGITRRGLEAMGAYYAQPENRPDAVLIYEDMYLPLINPMEPQFSQWYELIGQYKTRIGQLSAYKRR
jgi:hypothetical protein